MTSAMSTSPRLPSPPPTAEIQIGPASPGMVASRQVSEAEVIQHELKSKRRIHPGTRACDMAAGPPFIPLNEIDSAFQLQEHLAALHYHYSATRTQPITRTTAKQLANPPHSIDRTLWLYELCRFLISQCNSLIVGFLFDTPPCSATTCPEMRASEWQFLCAVHEQPKSCCAIDYCCHTLDWAANVVTDPKIFTSRLVALQDAHSKNIATKNLINVFRRLHRIFAHAWFQHRNVFWAVENQTGLYVFFKTVCDMYDLLPGETYKLPPEAEGLEAENPAENPAERPAAATGGGNGEKSEGTAPPTGSPPTGRHFPSAKSDNLNPGDEDHHHPGSRTNTRRHIRSNPSTGSAVTTVMESDEEESSEVTGKAHAPPSRPDKTKHLSLWELAPGGAGEVEVVPAIVEQAATPTEESTTKEATPLETKPEPGQPEESASAKDGLVEKEEPSNPGDPGDPGKPAEKLEDPKPQTLEPSTEEKPADPKPTEEEAPKDEGEDLAKSTTAAAATEETDDSELEERANTPDSSSTSSTSGVSAQDLAGELPLPSVHGSESSARGEGYFSMSN